VDKLQITPLTTALGAEIQGVDLRCALSDAEFDAIQQAFLTHHVLFFRDQDLQAGELLSYAKRFGEPIVHPMVASMTGFPGILEIVKNREDRNNFGGSWHTDLSFLQRPASISLLHAGEVPPLGGDTMFANMYLAYEALSTGMKNMLSGLNALHDTTLMYRSDAQQGSGTIGDEGSMNRIRPVDDHDSSLHPVVRTHPQTARQALYVNSNFTIGFEQMTRAESQPLLDYLFAHLSRAEFTCRFKWTSATLAMWDNRCTQHYALNDYHGQRRVVRRIAIEGDRPR
jgi:taurine dioxygenase